MTRRFGLWMCGVLASVAPAAGSLGCGSASCDNIAYRGGVAITLDGATPGAYRIQVDAWGETVVVACEATTCTTEQGGAGALHVLVWPQVADDRLIVEAFDATLADGPAQLDLRVARDGVEVLAVALTPTYEDAPSGGCADGTTIRRARMSQRLR